MPEDLSEYPSWLRDFPVYSAAERGAPKLPPATATRVPAQEQNEYIDPEEIALQAALAANSQFGNGPFSEEGQHQLKEENYEEPQGSIVSELLETSLPEPRYEEPESDYGPDDIAGISEEDEIPEGHFLLRSGSGDIFLKPCGFQDEPMFIVLYFDTDVLAFRPGLGTRFLGATDSGVGTTRLVYDLYFSGILFQVRDTKQTAVVFHRAQA